jgi:GNAT superfamily N-acetyltransferase
VRLRHHANTEAGMTIEIRQAQSADTTEVVAVLQEAAQWLIDRNEALWQADEINADAIARDVANGLFFVAECDGEVAGVVKFQLEDALFWPDLPSGEAAFVHRLAVRRRFAGRTVSTALLAWAARRTKSIGRRYLRLDTDAARPKLRAVYERFGFQYHSDRQVGPYLVARYQFDVLQGEPNLKLQSAITALAALSGVAHAAAPTTPNPGLKYWYPVPPANPAQIIKTDVCVYGGTPGGVAAAIQARRMGKTAALFVFRRHVGGMTSAGLTAVDLGKAQSIGGMAAEFFKRVGKWSGFKPSEAEKTFRAMLDEAGVPVYYEHRLQGVTKEGNQIRAVQFENGNRVEAKMYVDATYEGDLFAKAGVSYHIGREDNKVYGETINGFYIAKTHQFRFPVDPYRTPGDPNSGLLPGVSNQPVVPAGTGDNKIQAYNFRMWATTAEAGYAWPKPEGYNRDDFLLLLRYLTADPNAEWKFTYASGPVKLNLGDCNNAGPVSTDFVGGNYDWPDADHATREKIFQAHVNYQQGMMWFLANDEAVPAPVRDFTRKFGLPKNEFEETNGWPHELYVREARRMISDYVMTQKHCQSKEVAPDSVGLASYTMDSHHVQRIVVNGVVKGEGNVEVGVPQPYPVSYRSIVPKENECANLLVPVCLSSSHMAYGSIRMEPVFMILGQSAATAASLAIDGNLAVQKVDYAKLRERLLADGQKLNWTPEPPKETPK